MPRVQCNSIPPPDLFRPHKSLFDLSNKFLAAKVAAFVLGAGILAALFMLAATPLYASFSEEKPSNSLQVKMPDLASLKPVTLVHDRFSLSEFKSSLRDAESIPNKLSTIDSPAPVPHVNNSPLSAQDFFLRNYTEVAIATDLEPDDVFALSILFEEANRIYAHSPTGKYPIDLIIVGEGNTAIKRMRMEKLLKEYFHLPPGVSIEVVEGRATRDNIFSHDGEELFEKKTLQQVPFSEQEGQALQALRTWAEKAVHPFVIQLKPAQELLYLDAPLAAKTTVLFYGSFNIRRTESDPLILNDPKLEFTALPTTSARLEGIISYLSKRFSKIAILEGYGVLGDQSSVNCEHEWTKQIRELILHSDNAFIKMFRTLSSNWNAYILERYPDDTDLVNKITSCDIQFTLADILVALAASDTTNFFQATPVKVSFNQNNYLIPIPDTNSNLVYYNRADRATVADIIEQFPIFQENNVETKPPLRD